jgi:anti-anti-sigma factor
MPERRTPQPSATSGQLGAISVQNRAVSVEELPLRVAAHRLRGQTVVIPVGEIDQDSRDVLRDVLARCEGDVIIDLAGVPFVGSAGIGVIVSQRKRLEATGGTLHLRHSREITRRAFEAVGLADWLE